VQQKVDVEISISKGDHRKGTSPVVTTSVELRANGEEKTALRFKLDAEGNMEPNSMNNIFRPLRAARGAS